MYLSICLNIGRYSGFPPNQCLPISLLKMLKAGCIGFMPTHALCTSFSCRSSETVAFYYWLTQKRITAAGTAQVFHLIPFHTEHTLRQYAPQVLFVTKFAAKVVLFIYKCKRLQTISPFFTHRSHMFSNIIAYHRQGQWLK